ncbi:MAG: AI-2E family transporter [Burkholderiales bacterium]
MSARASAKRAAATATPTEARTAEFAEVAAIAAPAIAPKLTIIELTTLAIAVVVIVAAARVAEPFLVPVVAGILLSYALRPLVTLLERWRVPRLAAAALVMSVLVAFLSTAAYAIRDDVNAAVAELPGAARKLRVAINRSQAEPGPMTHVKEAAKELDRAAAEASGTAPAPAPARDQVATQVQTFVEAQYAKAMAVGSEILFAMLLAFFLLAAGDTFRRKVAKLAGDSLARRRVTVEVLNEIDSQVQRYLVTLLAANVLIAIATWVSLAMLGLPNAGMWGVITGILHVIPYAGAAIATVGIGIAMFLHSGSIASASIAMAVVAVIATLIGVAFLSWLQGRASRMNAVAVFIGVLFFGWLWGGWGLLLGLPILAVVKSISDRVESMRPVSELLGA